MVAGFDRYYQITKCFRDEDLRADRQPEFTQVDIEMSFVGQEDVLALMEDVMGEVMAAAGHELATPLPHITHAEALERFSSDRPDTRFGLELVDASSVFAASEFKVFAGALASGGAVKALNAKGAGDWSRGKIDALNQAAIDAGAKGLARVANTSEGDVKSPVAKFFTDAEMAALRETTAAEPGDLICMVADKRQTANDVLGVLRLRLADELGIERSGFNTLWVLGFPLFTWDDEGGRWDASHNPFMLPFAEHVDTLESAPGEALGYSYDLVMNGYEIGGGTLRIPNPELQMRVFKLMGMDDAEAHDKFGFLLEALSFGAPPHGGIALGLDRLVMLLAGAPSIRDVMAFPKTASAVCLMTQAPSTVDPEQLAELGIRVPSRIKE
jgi:aspartyl-tRNA synthetase